MARDESCSSERAYLRAFICLSLCIVICTHAFYIFHMGVLLRLCPAFSDLLMLRKLF